jgi:hypothetical protein
LDLGITRGLSTLLALREDFHQPFLGLLLPTRDQIRVNLVARRQLVRLRRTDRGWLMATKVLRDDDVVLEKIDEEFPRHYSGDVD